MEGMYLDIPRGYTALAEWAGCTVYLFLVERRFSKWKFGAVCAISLAVQFLWMTYTDDFPRFLWIPCMLAAAGFMFVFLYAAGKLSPLGAGYCCAGAFLAAEFAASLEWQICTYLAVIGLEGRFLRILLLTVIYGAVFAGVYVLEKPLFSGEYLEQLSFRELVSAVGIVVVIFTFSNLSFVLTNTPFTSEIQADIFNIRTLADAAGIAVLYGFQSRICQYLAQAEVMAIRSVLKNQYDQYRNYQNSLELIQIKYHDLKHQIAGLRAETDVERRKEWLDAMEKELEAHQLMDKTGNQVLDTILGAKLLQARKNQIQITCVADGTLLNFLHVTDICTIFGNALDNAMESVILQADPQKRLIHLSVSAQKTFVFIQVSNYCEEKPHMKAGQMPATTKSDKSNHGFGLKSIRYSAEKYGGTMSVDIKKNWFELRILLPRQ